MTYNDDIFYKIYMTREGPEVIEMQYFDEPDYVEQDFITKDCFDTETVANDTLDNLLIEVYGSHPEMDNMDRKVLLALYKKAYKDLKCEGVKDVLDNTMNKINEQLDLTSFEIVRIRRILSTAFLNINQDG